MTDRTLVRRVVYGTLTALATAWLAIQGGLALTRLDGDPGDRVTGYELTETTDR